MKNNRTSSRRRKVYPKKGLFNLNCKLLLIGLLSLALLFFGIKYFGSKEEQPAEKAQNGSVNGQVETGNKQGQDAKLSTQQVQLSQNDLSDPANIYVLVNKDHGLKNPEYKPADLVIPNIKTSASDKDSERSVRKIIAADLESMLTDAQAAGLDLTMNSGFRSFEDQQFYFNNYVKNSGREAALKFSALPGFSEHQTGLGIDINYSDRKCYLEECFGQSAAGIWLAGNSYKYGFILRYPKGKEDVTGYQYEPWHFRYLGKALAKDVKDSGLSYEEYLKSLNLI
jgi:D-alanyl-D-alanine carboxypeptidase